MTTVLDTTAHSGRQLKPTNLPQAKAITVNGVAIPKDAIAREVQNHPASKPVDAWLSAGRALVVRELLLQEARRLGLTPEPLEDDEGRRETGDEALIRSLIERQVAVPTVDAASCRRIYEQQPQRFRSPDIYEVRHILLAAPPSDKAARDAARVMAARLIADIAAHPDHFAELAAQNSLCPSARSGGSLGQISQGQTVPEFEMALRGLPTGVVAPQPVETRYGVHVVCVDRHIEGSYLPFELVSERIAQWLAAKARREAIRQYIAFLASRAEIEGIDLDTADQRFASPGA